MATSLGPVLPIYQTLIKEWAEKPVNLEKVGKLLTNMKVDLKFWYSILSVWWLFMEIPIF